MDAGANNDPQMGFFGSASSQPTGFRPLADRLRPASLDEMVGQEHLVGPSGPLRSLIETDALTSLILWGPPGSGKTTLARIISRATQRYFVSFSAVTAGIPALKRVVAQAQRRRASGQQDTILFVDEIHRFNKAQQDAFLPHIENGTIVLIGATTENPSFEVNAPLLSRSRVFVLHPLEPSHLETLLQRALQDPVRGLGEQQVQLEKGLIRDIAHMAHGDARVALNVLELSVEASRSDNPPCYVSRGLVQRVVQTQLPRYDKSGEEHYNLISAVHKSLRDSDPDAAVYWVTRMLRGGEDPRYLARRLIRFASEDIGNADPQALTLAVSAMQAVHFLGMPEADLALVQAATYLALAPKSNAVYAARKQAQADIKRWGALPVPLTIRNAPTRLMRELGYGKGYQYAHDAPDAVVNQPHLPEELANRKYYHPSSRGFEKELRRRLAEFQQRRRQRYPS